MIALFIQLFVLVFALVIVFMVVGFARAGVTLTNRELDVEAREKALRELQKNPVKPGSKNVETVGDVAPVNALAAPVASVTPAASEVTKPKRQRKPRVPKPKIDPAAAAAAEDAEYQEAARRLDSHLAAEAAAVLA